MQLPDCLTSDATTININMNDVVQYAVVIQSTVQLCMWQMDKIDMHAIGDVFME